MLGESVPQIAPVGAALLQKLSGLEILAAQIKGEIPAAPIDRYAGIRLIGADDGRAVFSLPVHSNLVQELGTVFGGVIALLAKSASGAAVQTIAPARTGFTALDLKVNFLRPVRAEGEELIATGSVNSSWQQAEHRQRCHHLPRPSDCDRHGNYRPHAA